MLSLLSVISIFGIGLDVDYKLALAILIAAQVIVLLLFLIVLITLLRRASKSIDEAIERSEARRKERREKRKAVKEAKKAEKESKKVEEVTVTEETTVEKTKLTRKEKKALKAEEKAKKKQAKLEAKNAKKAEKEAKKQAKLEAKAAKKAEKDEEKATKAAERESERLAREEERLAREEADRIRKEEERRKREEEKRLAEEEKRLAEEAAKAAAAATPVLLAVTEKPEKSKAPVERKLLKISIETGIVQRHFTVGETFNCDGLLVVAHYNLEPTEQAVLGHTIIERDEYMKLADVQKLIGAYVLKPNLNEEGIKAVVIRYGDRAAVYTISVKPPVKVEPVSTPEPVVVERVVEKIVEVPVEKVVEAPVEKTVEVPTPPAQTRIVETVLIGEESVEASRLRYDKSFEAKFIQSDDETKHWYTEIKNCLLSYKGCKGRISWKRETFKAKKEVVAKLVFRGNTLCLFLPLNPSEFTENKEVEDGSNMPVYEDTPLMIRIKNEKRKRLAITLIERVMMERGILHGAHQSEDFYLPYEGVVELINRGLIKREIKTVEDEAIFERDKVDED